MTGMKRVRLHISGTVQGVWFRESTRQEAELLGVAGWVKNNPDGTVEAAFEGHPLAVDRLTHWCQIGPDRAKVDEVRVEEEEPKGEKGFKVLR
jgi:acylphosphatase